MKSRLHHPPKIETMKCVRINRLVSDEKIMRVPNEAAEALVKSQGGKYVPKKEFKAQERAKQERKAA